MVWLNFEERRKSPGIDYGHSLLVFSPSETAKLRESDQEQEVDRSMSMHGIHCQEWFV